MIIEFHDGILIFRVQQCYKNMQVLFMQRVHLQTPALDLLMEQSGPYLALVNTKELYTMVINVFFL